MAEQTAQQNSFERVSAPKTLDEDTLRLLRLREAGRCAVFAAWAALQPREDAWSGEALDELRGRLMRVASLGAEPVLCLYRGEDPAWFVARGGWQKEDNLRCYLRYVGRVVREVGHLCADFLTFYEPNALVWESGERRPSLRRAATALSHMACTHIRAVRLIRDTRAQRELTDTAVGVVVRLYPAAALRAGFLRGRLPTASLYGQLPLLAMTRGEFHAPLRNTLRVQPGVWADYIGVTGAQERCARVRELTGIEPRIMEE